MTRKITMELDASTTDTACGKCPARHAKDGQSWRPWCGAFRSELRTRVVWSDTFRLDECIASEKALGEAGR